MKKYAAFFDLDHTILSTSSGRLFVKYAYQNGLIGTGDLLRGICIGLLHRIGVISTEKVIMKWVERYAGASEKETIEISNKWFHEVVTDHFRSSILDEIEYHKKNGARLVILSASTPYICRPVRDYLEMDDIICTELDSADGIFTGKLSGDYCQGRVKLERVIEYSRQNGFVMEDAFYYGDSIADRFVLNAVGNPVCVSPDWRLRSLAERSRWRIIER